MQTVFKNKEDWFLNGEPEPNTGCLIWMHALGGKGYGRFFFNGKIKLAHRMSYELFKGEIPDGLMVRHICHNPVCFNPDHLLIGTAKDNSQDMVRAGRHPKPCLGVSKTEEHKRKISNAVKSFNVKQKETGTTRFKKRKITLEDANNIRKMFANGVTAKELSNQYGYSSTTEIYRIVKGERWNNV